MRFPKKTPRIGLALGSGSARGFSHIGVLKTLERHGIMPSCIAGSSIGAIIGGTYAVHKDIRYVEELALKTNWRELLSLADPSLSSGLLAGEKLLRFLEEVTEHATFDTLALPFVALATDVSTGNAVVLREGSVAEAIRASCAIPLAFRPVTRGTSHLSDGGLSEPVPAQAARELGADCVIAVNLSTHVAEADATPPSMYSMMQNVLWLLQVHLARENIRSADFVISPKVHDIGWGSMLTREKTAEVIRRGEVVTEEALPGVLQTLKKREKTFWTRLCEYVTRP